MYQIKNTRGLPDVLAASCKLQAANLTTTSGHMAEVYGVKFNMEAANKVTFRWWDNQQSTPIIEINYT